MCKPALFRAAVFLFVFAVIGVPLTTGWRTSDVNAAESSLTGIWRNRSPERRVELSREYGGSAESEAAVTAALAWIVRHQNPDGGWSFLYRQPDCDQTCQHEGAMKNTRHAATGLALLALLGGGHSPNLGEHREAVRKGCEFLIANQSRETQRVGSLADGGTMYSHGIATQALCEAYGMSQDEKLKGPATDAVKHTLFAQHEQGGWRYMPKQPGDTSVTGWQLGALFTARHAGIDVPDKAFETADAFFDYVADRNGISYGYTSNGNGIATSAIGLWSRSQFPSRLKPEVRHQGLNELLKRLSQGSTANTYSEYYVTLAAFQRADEAWRDWNGRVRDRLVKSQEKKGHARGSWETKTDSLDETGGRLYLTTLHALTLEVYYRYPPRLRVE